MAAEALALHIAGMIEDGEVVPDTSNLDALANDPNMWGDVAFLLSVEPEPEKNGAYQYHSAQEPDRSYQ